MSVYLVDVNALIALFWPSHPSHDTVHNWFGRVSRRAWASCPFTQTAFVRIVSNPVFSRDALQTSQAIAVLEANLTHPNHRFWPDDLGFVDAVRKIDNRLQGHRQITDAYLLALAIHRKGKLATLDRAVLALAANHQGAVKLIS